MDQQQPEVAISSEVSGMGLAKTMNKAKDWKIYKIIKKGTRQVNRRAYQNFVKDTIAEDTQKNCGV